MRKLFVGITSRIAALPLAAQAVVVYDNALGAGFSELELGDCQSRQCHTHAQCASIDFI